MSLTVEKLNTCKAVITVMSVLTFQRLTAQEREAERRNMGELISMMDRQRIPWRLQNALLYIGESYDVRAWYLDKLLNLATVRAALEV